jgi:hypothetical protein
MVHSKIHISIELCDVLVKILMNDPISLKRIKRFKLIYAILSVICVMIGVTCVIEKSFLGCFICLILLIIFLQCCLCTKRIQKKAITKKMQKSLDCMSREYFFDSEGIRIKSDMGDSLTYWKSYLYYGEVERYIYLMRSDYQIVIVEVDKLSLEELSELKQLLSTYCNKV